MNNQILKANSFHNPQDMLTGRRVTLCLGTLDKALVCLTLVAYHTSVMTPSRSIHNPAVSRLSIRTGLLVLVVSVHPAIGKDGKLKGGRLLGVARGIFPMDLVEAFEFV